MEIKYQGEQKDREEDKQTLQQTRDLCALYKKQKLIHDKRQDNNIQVVCNLN